MASIASAVRTRVAYIAEVTSGTTPATPAFTTLRVTGAGIQTNKKTTPIREIRSDLNVPDEIESAQSAAAAYSFALSYGTFDDIMAAVLRSSWSSDVVKNGTSRTTFTFEETLNFIGSLGFSRVTYGIVDTFSLDITAEREITGNFNVVGMKEELDTAIIASATYTAVNANPVMSAGNSVAALSVASLTTPKIRRVMFEVKNGTRIQPVVDSLYPGGFGDDLMDVTGTIEVYFDGNAAYQKVLDHGGGALSITIGNASGSKYTIAFPTIVFLDGKRQVGGTSSDVMVSIPFRAKGSDNSSNPSISITRAVS